MTKTITSLDDSLLDNSLGEADLKLMLEIEKNSSINQRALAKTFNVSLGKINY